MQLQFREGPVPVSVSGNSMKVLWESYRGISQYKFLFVSPWVSGLAI